jgi:Calcineurin-like phosphoesterase
MNELTPEFLPAEIAEDQRVRMVVISDIHATESGNPLTNVAESTESDPSQNALIAACELIHREAADADCIICPGDLVNEGETAPMGWVWRKLQELSQGIDAPLVATVGNHDVALKATGAERPNSALRDLDPRFPYPEQTCLDTYWAHDFAVVSQADWRVLAVNSSAQLGFYDESERDHGRLGRHCMRELPKRLDEIGAGKPINVCIVHHHPQEWTEDSDRPTSHMTEGDRLIELLEGRPERWMMIHGHMHHPRLDYIGYGSGGTVRLASGSIGANLLSESGVQVRNQIHIVDFDLGARDLGLVIAGEVRSFDWEPGQGWLEPGPQSGLADREPFGYRRDGLELAAWLHGVGRERDQRSWKWEEVVAIEPRCRYLAGIDRRAFHAGIRGLKGGVVEEREEVTFQW